MDKKENDANQYIKKNRGLAARTSQHPALHFTPPVGWMNDPNGLIFFNNEYHLFYQHHPYKTKWHQMYWGHAVSEDLIKWKDLPIALAPSEEYENSSEGGCFSGTAIEHMGKLYLFYTAVARNIAGDLIQRQCLAMSENGVCFSKYENNPIIQNDNLGNQNSHFRDPKVWKYDKNFYMLVGVSQNQVGKLLLYCSENLFDWTFVNVAFEEHESWMLECPDFYELDGKEVLTFSPVGIKGEYSTYIIGKMDYQKGQFNIESRGILDYGIDFYAPQTFVNPEGERYVMGWQNGWEWMDEWNGFGELAENSWCGAMSIPRKIKIKNNRLHSMLPEQISALKSSQVIVSGTQTNGYLKKISNIQTPTIIELSINSVVSPITLVFKDERNGLEDTFIIQDQVRYHSKGNPLGRKDLSMPLSDKSRKIKILIDLYSIEFFDEEEGTVLSVNSFFKGAIDREFLFSCCENNVVEQLLITQLNAEKLINGQVKG